MASPHHYRLILNCFTAQNSPRAALSKLPSLAPPRALATTHYYAVSPALSALPGLTSDAERCAGYSMSFLASWLLFTANSTLVWT